MRKPFRLASRNGWFAEIEHADGRAERRKFEKHEEASTWLVVEAERSLNQHGPLLGGPGALTLGQMLGEYASRFTVAKGGYATELIRINHSTPGSARVSGPTR